MALDWLEVFPTVGSSTETVCQALALAAAGRASYCDALLIVTAAAVGCRAILTEDLADSVTLSGVRVVNPFDGQGISEPAERVLAAG